MKERSLSKDKKAKLKTGNSKFCNISIMHRGVSGYLTLGGQIVMWRAAAAARRLLLFCQKLGGQLPTLTIRHLRP